MTSLRDVFVAALKSLLRGKSFLRAILAFWVNPAAVKTQDAKLEPAPGVSLAEFLNEAEKLLLGPVDVGGLAKFSAKLKCQFRQALLSNPACMLPSYNHQLPTGHERGQFLALDVGGSTLRVALVELSGRGHRTPASSIVHMDSFRIDPDVKSLRGLDFFEWMAQRISQTVSRESKRGHSPNEPLLVGMAWSFPVEYVSQTSSAFQS